MLVEAALGLLEESRRPVVVDVGTGAGAIALAIADERPDAVVLATDLSRAAVALARRNADRLGLRIEVHPGDLLLPVRALAGRIDLVVSNPPYVARDRMDDLPAEVRAEPELALAGDIEIYERLAAEAGNALRPGGGIAVEIAEDRGGDVADVMAGSFADVLVLRDLSGRDRFVLGRRA
jgi:release factor glutamine methyltransferase